MTMIINLFDLRINIIVLHTDYNALTNSCIAVQFINTYRFQLLYILYTLRSSALVSGVWCCVSDCGCISEWFTDDDP